MRGRSEAGGRGGKGREKRRKGWGIGEVRVRGKGARRQGEKKRREKGKDSRIPLQRIHRNIIPPLIIDRTRGDEMFVQMVDVF